MANTTHIFIEPVSKIEISASEIRSRINSPIASFVTSSPSLSGAVVSLPTSPDYTTSDTISDCESATDTSITAHLEKTFLSAKSPNSRPVSSIKTDYHSCLEDSKLDQTTRGLSSSELWLTIFCEEVSLTLTDDCIEDSNQMDEYCRATLDTLVLTVKPRMVYSQPMKCTGDALPTFSDLTLTIGNIQLDNQMFHKGHYDFPVLLKGQEMTPSINKTKTSKLRIPAFNLPNYLLEQLKQDSLVNLSLSFDANTDQRVLKTVHLQVRPLNIFIEDVFAYKIAAVARSFSPRQSCGENTSTILQEVVLSSKNLSVPIFLDSLRIEPLHALVSVHASIKVYVGLDQSPLNFSAYNRENIITTNYAIGQNLARHFISGALFRAGWVIGSLEMIGSPAGFTRAVGDGIVDFVSLPYNGIFQGPWAFLSGITHGSSSLVKHVSAGTLTSVTNFASSVSRNLDRLSWDREHCQRNEVARRSLPQGIGQGFVNGLSGVGISILGAIGGIAHHPIQSLIDHGATPTGLVGGLTRGLIGVITKPIGGAAELVAQTGQGLLVGTGWTQNMKQRSPALPQHVCSVGSSALKFEWKLVGNCIVIMMAEVTQALDDGSMVAATLILTPDAIFVIAAEEDCIETVLSISEVKVTACKDDPTRLEICSHPKESHGSRFEQEFVANERVVQFVMESGLHATISDMDEFTDDAEDESNRKKKDKGKNAADEKATTYLVFYANPSLRTAFLDAFIVADCQSRGVGFTLV
jgi:vacuolar protein sorting-associated protein 13B